MLDNLKNLVPFLKELVVISRIFFKLQPSYKFLILLCKLWPVISIIQQFLVRNVTLIHLDMVCLCSCNCILVAILRIIFVEVVRRVLNI